jgi:hypothetical protein
MPPTAKVGFPTTYESGLQHAHNLHCLRFQFQAPACASCSLKTTRPLRPH